MLHRVFVAALVVGSCGLVASSAQAATFTVNFCPGDDTCPSNLTEASLTFDEILTGDDPNDYNLTIRIVGVAGSPELIDSVQFAITGVDAPTGYEGQPSLLSAPAAGSPWTPYWDVIAGNPADCSGDTFQGQGICAQSTGYGETTEGTNEWEFYLNLADDQDPLSTESYVNLRAHFIRVAMRQGEVVYMPGGNLSPGGGYLETTGGGDTTGGEDTSGTLPEPASLALFGAALTAAAWRMRCAR